MLSSASAGFTVRPRWLAVIAIAALMSLLTMASSAQAAPPGAQSFGISTGGAIQSEDPATLAKDLDAIAGTGAKWIRIDINWAQVQSGGPTSYDWTGIDRLVRGASARGISVLGGIMYTPEWARPSGTSATYGPDPAKYAAFAKVAAAHYSALGVHAYEVWNEPNIKSFWTPSPNVGDYTRLLKAAYPAIKSADPQATVLSGGTAPAPDDGTSYSPVTFLKGIYANGGGDSFDAVSHHPYVWPVYPGDAQAWSAWYQMYGTNPSLRSVMTANGDAGKKIWATEFGAPTNGPAGSFVSEGEQAKIISKGYAVWRTYDWAGPLFTYQGRDQGTSNDTRESHFGLLHNNWSPKPAYDAYRQAVAAATGATRANPTPADPATPAQVGRIGLQAESGAGRRGPLLRQRGGKAGRPCLPGPRGRRIQKRACKQSGGRRRGPALSGPQRRGCERCRQFRRVRWNGGGVDLGGHGARHPERRLSSPPSG
jgi:hypothetical protein